MLWMSEADLFAGTALAKAIAPAARTVKMVEKRMVKRLEKGYLGRERLEVLMRDLYGIRPSFYRQSRQQVTR